MDDAKQFVEVATTLPTRSTNTVNKPARGNAFGEQMVNPIGKGRYAFCDEGQYFVAKNTPGTGIAGIAATGAYSDAESFLLIKNGAGASSGTRLYLDYLRVVVTAAGANGTDHLYAIKLEPSGTDRYTSGGSAITPVNPNVDSSIASGATIKVGALVTTAASSNARLVAAGVIRPVIAVVGDQYIFDFGGEVQSTSMVNAGTAIAHCPINCPPIIIGPGCTMVMSLYASSQTAACSYEFELGYWER